MYGPGVDCELSGSETLNCKVHELVIRKLTVLVRKSDGKPQRASKQAILINNRKAVAGKYGSCGRHVLICSSSTRTWKWLTTREIELLPVFAHVAVVCIDRHSSSEGKVIVSLSLC